MHNIRKQTIRQTFTFPFNVYQRFAALVPGGKRSAVISALIEKEIKKREQSLIRSCEKANQDAGLAKLEQDLQALEDTVGEPFDPHAW